MSPQACRWQGSRQVTRLLEYFWQPFWTGAFRNCLSQRSEFYLTGAGKYRHSCRSYMRSTFAKHMPEWSCLAYSTVFIRADSQLRIGGNIINGLVTFLRPQACCFVEKVDTCYWTKLTFTHLRIQERRCLAVLTLATSASSHHDRTRPHTLDSSIQSPNTFTQLTGTHTRTFNYNLRFSLLNKVIWENVTITFGFRDGGVTKMFRGNGVRRVNKVLLHVLRVTIERAWKEIVSLCGW